MDNLNYRFGREGSSEIKQRWGTYTKQPEQETSLLIKKDQQIKRLQAELQSEKKRADNALKMLDSFRNSHRLEQELSSNAKSEISRRLKAEEDARKLRNENQKLRELLNQHLGLLEGFQSEINASAQGI